MGVLVLLAVVGAVWYFGGNAEAPAQRVELTVAELPISYGAVSHLANELGYYTEEGVTMTVNSVPAGPDVVASLRSPSGAGFGTIAVTPVVTLIGAGENPIVLATTLTSNEQVQLVTFAKTGITEDPKTLKGKKIGRVRNTVGEIYLSRLLEKGGLKDADVTLVDGRPADLMNLLVKGDIDAAALWDPFVPQAKRSYEEQLAKKAVSDRGTTTIIVDKSLYTLAFNIVTTKEKLESNKAAVEGVIRALIKAEDYIRKDPAGAQTKLEAWLNLQAGDLDHFMQTTSFKVELNVPQMKQWLAGELAWLKGVQDVKDTRTDMAPFIDASFLKSIDSTRVTD